MKEYCIDLKGKVKEIYSGHLKIGGENLRGDTISFTNYYMQVNGKPFFAIAGEFHFSRCDYLYWESEILKMKAAGINIITTYIFWIHHEEEQGEFVWDEDRNVRYFVELCAKHHLYIILRVGPFNHGEVRNGGLPDWLYGRPFSVRSNDEGYLFFVKRLYMEIGKQVQGQMFKDNGPVVGIQLENEYMAASAPWEFLVSKDYEWIADSGEGEAHIRVLKDIAIESGLIVPIYTCTAWDGSPLLEDETLPLSGGYSFRPWTISENSPEHAATGEYLFQNFHDDNFKHIGKQPTYNIEKYPYSCCELGGGMACWYKYRFVVSPESVEAATIIKIAGGCNFIGYYMFHDGTNPVGKHSYLNERVVPKISYYFQAPLGEYGQIRDSYRYLKPIFYFIKEFEEIICPMGTTIPEGIEKVTSKDTETLRYAIRQKDGSGFIFLVNFQDHFEMKDHENISIRINLPEETIILPSEKGFCLKKNTSAILPFNFSLDGALLKYSTTQLVTSILQNGVRTYFFFVPDGMKGEYCFDASSIESIESSNGIVEKNNKYTNIYVNEDKECIITLTASDGTKTKICTLTRKQILGLWKYNLWGQERIILSNADVIAEEGIINLSRIGNPDLSFSIFPPLESEIEIPSGKLKGKEETIFEHFEIKLPEKNIKINVEKIEENKAVLNIPADSFDGVNEVYLNVDYLGNVGNAFIDGKLVSDNFYNGNVWQIGLKRLGTKVLEKCLYFHIIPFIIGSDVILDDEIKFKHDFLGDRIAKILSISAVVEYSIKIFKP